MTTQPTNDGTAAPQPRDKQLEQAGPVTNLPTSPERAADIGDDKPLAPELEQLEQLALEICGDIDQVIVQDIFKKLATGNKKKDDALWALTTVAAVHARELLKTKMPALLAQASHTAVVEARINTAKYFRGYVGGTQGRLAESISGPEVLEEINAYIARLEAQLSTGDAK